jgi:quercetin dioxygenase-like cupin family protein
MMKIQNYRQVKGKEEVQGVTMHVVAGPDEGVPNFVMRVFELKPLSATPFHSHPWEHEVFIVSGKGIVKSEREETALKEGDAIYVKPGEKHCFNNAGKDVFRFVCLVPLIDGKMPGSLSATKPSN